MATSPCELLSFRLNQLFKNDPSWTLEAVVSGSGVPRETVRRLLKGEVGNPRASTLDALSRFLEKASGGVFSKDFRDVDLTGADLSGADLSGADFTNGKLQGANLSGANIDGAKFDLADMREVEMVGVTGTASFQCANLCGSEIGHTTIDWVMTGALVRNSHIHDVIVEEEARLNSVDFSGAETLWERLVWRANGSRTIGARLSDNLDLSEIRGAFCDHLLMSRTLEESCGISLSKATGDQEILRFAEYLSARENSLLSCYDGGARRLLYHQPEIIDTVLDVWGRYDGWWMKERLQIALHVEQYCKTIDDFVDLRNSVFYSSDFLPAPGTQNSQSIIEKYIKRALKGEFIGQTSKTVALQA